MRRPTPRRNQSRWRRFRHYHVRRVAFSLVATTIAVAAVSTGSVSGCGTRHRAQAEKMASTVSGVSGESTDREITIQDAVIVYRADGYTADSTAPLSLRVFNDSARAITLTRVTTRSTNAIVALVGQPGESRSSVPPSPISPPPTAVSPPPVSASPPPAVGSENERVFAIDVAANGFKVLAPDGAHLALVLEDPLAPGESVNLDFTFDGGTTISLAVPMGMPTW